MAAQSDRHGFSLTHGAAAQALFMAVALIALAAIALWFFGASSSY